MTLKVSPNLDVSKLLRAPASMAAPQRASRGVTFCSAHAPSCPLPLSFPLPQDPFSLCAVPMATGGAALCGRAVVTAPWGAEGSSKRDGGGAGRPRAARPHGGRRAEVRGAPWGGVAGPEGRGEAAAVPGLTAGAFPRSLLDVARGSEPQTLDASRRRIARIEGLGRLRGLQHLDLSANRIRRIEGLSALGSLRTLNLSGNLITKVEGRQCLFQSVWQRRKLFWELW